MSEISLDTNKSSQMCNSVTTLLTLDPLKLPSCFLLAWFFSLYDAGISNQEPRYNQTTQVESTNITKHEIYTLSIDIIENDEPLFKGALNAGSNNCMALLSPWRTAMPCAENPAIDGTNTEPK